MSKNEVGGACRKNMKCVWWASRIKECIFVWLDINSKHRQGSFIAAVFITVVSFSFAPGRVILVLSGFVLFSGLGGLCGELARHAYFSPSIYYLSVIWIFNWSWMNDHRTAKESVHRIGDITLFSLNREITAQCVMILNWFRIWIMLPMTFM